MNNLPRSVTSHVFLFADDTKLIQSISTLADHAQLQTDLDNLAKWCDAWQLNFNAKLSILVEPHIVMEATI